MFFYLDDAIFEGLVLEQPRDVAENIRRGTNAIHGFCIAIPQN